MEMSIIKMMKSTLIIITSLYSSSLGELQQLHTRKLLCPNDDVVFRCVNYVNTDVHWIIKISLGYTYRISFSSQHNSVGDVRTGNLEPPIFRAEVTFTNISSIVSTVTLLNAANLNGTGITCNGDNITLLLNSINSEILPTVIVITQLGLTYNFSISWNLEAPHEILDHYNITLVPPPYGLSTIITNDASVTLRLKKDTSYKMIISATFCANFTLSHNFVAGRCPFLMVRAIQVIYYIWQNGSLNGLIECADGKEILLYCGVNGSWVNHTEDTCIEENEEAHNVDSTISLSDFTEKVHDNLVNGECNQQYLPLIAGVSSGSLIFTLMISIATFMLGLICRAKNKKQEVKPNSVYTLPEALVYEEIQPRKHDKFEFTHNTAYGDVGKP